MFQSEIYKGIGRQKLSKLNTTAIIKVNQL